MKRWLRQRWHLVTAILLLVYFAYHGVHGERGLLAWVDKSRQLEDESAKLKAVEAEIAGYQAKIAALQTDRADPDLLEEQLRQLGYIGKQEVIVLPAASPPTRP